MISRIDSLREVGKTVKNSFIRKTAFIVTAAVFLFSATMVVRHRIEMNIGAEKADVVVQMAVTHIPDQEKSPKETETVFPSQQPENENENNPDPEPAAPIQVDFDALFKENQDVVAWLYCPDTPINYPVVQSTDNNYYLRRLLDKSYNSLGTLFIDCRNAGDFSDWNSVIYGHNMKNDSMFGTLPNYKNPGYFQEHPELFLLTPDKDYCIHLIAGFTTPANSELYSIFAPDSAEASRLIENWIVSSDFDSGIRPSAEDRLITLSTCSYEYDNARYVLIGILKECRR